MAQGEAEDILAGDYVLGLMDANEAAFFERRMRNEPALALRVETWRRRVAELEGRAPPPAPRAMWSRIEAGFSRQPSQLPRNRLRMAALPVAILALAAGAAWLIAVL